MSDPEAGLDLKSDTIISHCLLTYLKQTFLLVVTYHHTWLFLTNEAIVLHLAGAGGPHPSFPFWVAVNHHHTVSLRQ